MQRWGRSFSVVALVLATACGGTSEEGEHEASGALELEATGTQAQGIETQEFLPNPSVWVRGCEYKLALVESPPYMLSNLVLSRQVSPRCAPGSVLLQEAASVFGVEGGVLAEHRNQLVVIWRHYLNPEVTIHQLAINHISPETLQVVRQARLAAYYRSGSIEEASLEFQGHHLIIHGRKSGVFQPDEPFGYSSFTATYPRFFTSTEPPDVVVF
jgi:hypothetical protein